MTSTTAEMCNRRFMLITNAVGIVFAMVLFLYNAIRPEGDFWAVMISLVLIGWCSMMVAAAWTRIAQETR